MDSGRVAMTEQERTEIIDSAFRSSMEKHVRLGGNTAWADGFLTMYIDTDIALPKFLFMDRGERIAYAKELMAMPDDASGYCFEVFTLQSGVYYLSLHKSEAEGKYKPLFGDIYEVELTQAGTEKVLDLVNKSGDVAAAYNVFLETVEDETEQIELFFRLSPIRQNGAPINVVLAMVWAAVQDASDEGDFDRADDILYAAFGMPRNVIRFSRPRQETVSLTGVKPRTTYYPIDKATKHLTDPDAWGEGVSLDVGRRKGTTFVQLALNLEDHVPVTTSEYLDHRDREIIAAVDSLKIEATNAGMDAVISAANVCEAMGETHPEPARQAEVEARMRRLTDVKVTIDFTDEALQRHLPMTDPDTGARIARAVISGRAIEARIIETTDENGRVTTRFQLLGHTPTYRHAHEIRQVASWPNELLSLPAIRPDGQQYGKSSTPRQTSIKHGVLEFVSSIKRGKNRPTFLSYDGLCRDIGVDPSKRSSRKEVIDFAEGYLRALQGVGEVKDYQPRTVGRSHKKTGVDVFV